MSWQWNGQQNTTKLIGISLELQKVRFETAQAYLNLWNPGLVFLDYQIVIDTDAFTCIVWSEAYASIPICSGMTQSTQAFRMMV